MSSRRSATGIQSGKSHYQRCGRGKRDEEARKKKREKRGREGKRDTEEKSKTGGNVEKLHPAHCIEIQEKERLRQKRDEGAEG